MTKIIHTSIYKTPFGELLLGVFKEKLVLCDWRYRKQREVINKRLSQYLDAEFNPGESAVLDNTKTQLEEYFKGNRNTFSVPISCIGTDFQKLVWEALQNIPFGTTSSYLALSKKLGNEKAIRAVATANGANALSILIPCHRVIGADGSLVGYAGGLKAKEGLLKLEGALESEQMKLF